jgi:phytoene/squalene synthetase
MLRDALEDLQAGYYNIPSQVIAASGIAPWDVESNAYRDWVNERVCKARACFRMGRAYLAQVENLRCRIAGYAYIHRFETVLDSIERAGYVLQARYPQPKGGRRGVELIGWALTMALNHRPAAPGVPTGKGHVKL